MSSKKMLIVSLGILVFVIAIIYIYNEKLTNVAKYYYSEVYVTEDGEINVKETIVIDFRQYMNYLYRDIVYENSHGEPGTLDKKNLSVKVYQGDIIDGDDYEDITENVKIGYSFNGDTNRYGDAVECPCEPEYCPGYCESIYIDADKHGSFDGVYSYTFDYYLTDMVTVYNDCAEFNYKMFEYLGFKTEVAATTVFLPASTYDKENFYAYGHGLYDGWVEIVNNREYSFIGEDVAADEEMEFRIVFPTGVLVDKNDPSVKYTIIEEDKLDNILEYENLLAEQSNRYYYICSTTDIITVLWVIGMIIATAIVYVKYDREFEPNFDGEYYRELPRDYPPAVMSYLYYFQKTIDEDFTATVLNLIRKKVLILDCLGDVNDKDCDYKLTYNTEFSKNQIEAMLENHEVLVFNWLIATIGNGKEVTFAQIESFGKTYSEAKNSEDFGRDFRKYIENDADNYDFFIEKGKDKLKASLPGWITLIGAAVIFIVMVITGAPLASNIFAFAIVAIIYFLYVANIKKRSVNGNEEYHMWKAFKNFLEDFGNLKDQPVLGIEVWEEYLVYATSLKVADKVMDQLKVKLPDMNTESATFMVYSPRDMYYRHMIFHRINRSYSRVRSNSTASIMEHNARNRSGGGRSGGFSGGSSFGGGGGGFRSGR